MHKKEKENKIYIKEKKRRRKNRKKKKKISKEQKRNSKKVKFRFVDIIAEFLKCFYICRVDGKPLFNLYLIVGH